MKMYIHTKTYTQNVRSSCLCNCHGNMETIQISFYRWKVKLLVHPDRGTPLSNKEEQTIDTGRSLNRSRGTVWWKQPVSKCRILPGSVYITYSRPQIYKDGEQVSGWPRQQVKWAHIYTEGNSGGPSRRRDTLYLAVVVATWDYTWKPQKRTHTRKQSKLSKVCPPLSSWAALVAQQSRIRLQCRMQVWSLRWEDALEKEMTTHSSILAWEIPWTEEPGGLQCM